jgi:flagellin-like protein
MFNTLTDNEKRGQVGIGTLIVFIAMVLVAAIAAGVLINTAGFLQTQAEATGEESTAQVTNNIDIVSSIGTGGPPLDTVTLVLKKSAGSDPIDLSQVEIQYVGPSNVITTNLGNAGGVTFDEVAGSSGAETLSDQADRTEVVISLSAFGGDNLAAGESVEVTLTTASGAQTFETLRVSDPAEPPEDL